AIEQMAAIDTIIFDKTGTISSPSVSGIAFEGFLTQEEKVLVYSACRNSSHPLSREIVKWLDHIEPIPVDRYEEKIGEGSITQIGKYTIKIGSARFVNAPKNTEEA